MPDEPIAEVIERVLRPTTTTTLTQLAHDACRLARELEATLRVIERWEPRSASTSGSTEYRYEPELSEEGE